MGWKAAGGPQGGSSLLRKFWSRESAGFPARQGAGEGRCRGQAKRGRPAAPRKSKAKWRACSLLGLGLLQGEGRPKGASAPPFGRPGRAEIQRKYRVTSAPGPADGRRLHGFAAPVRGKCGCGGWPQQNPPGVRQIQAHPRRQSAPARPR